MGIYSKQDTTTTIVAEGSYEPNMVGALQIVAENEMNYNAIMKGVALSELAYLEANGTDMVYTEATNTGFFAKVKEFFMKVLSKVKAMFAKFFALFDSYTKTDKEFLNKYQLKLRKLVLKDFEYSGYEFKNTDTTLDTGAALCADDFRSMEVGAKKVFKGESITAPEAKVALTYFEDHKEDLLDGIRGDMIGQSNSGIDASSFSKELFEYFRNGSSSKDTLDIKDLNAYLKVIGDAAGNKKNAEKNQTKFENEMRILIKSLDTMEKGINNEMKADKTKNADVDSLNSSKIRIVSEIISVLKSGSSIATQANAALLAAIRDENRQAKSICVAALSKFGGAIKEGFTHYTEGTTGGYLDNVVLK